MRKFLIVFILFCGCILNQSCQDQYDFATDKLSENVDASPDLAIPLVDASFTLEEFMTKNTSSYLLVDNDKFITLVYEYTIKEITAPDFFGGTYNGTLALINYDIPSQVFNMGKDRALSNEEFYVKDPLVTISITNFWDIPVQFQLVDFKYYNDANPSGLPITGSFVTDWHDVTPPTVAGGFAVTNLFMDNTNSNLDEVISAMPTQLSTAAILQTTPGGAYNVDPQTTDTVRLKIELPLDLRIKNLLLSDTLDFKAGEKLGADTSKLESLKLNMVFENGFPLDVEAMVILADTNYIPLDTIANPGEDFIDLPSASVSGGKVSSASKYTLMGIEVKKEVVVKTVYLITSFRFNTYNNQLGETVKIYSGYNIGLKVGALIKLKI